MQMNISYICIIQRWLYQRLSLTLSYHMHKCRFCTAISNAISRRCPRWALTADSLHYILHIIVLVYFYLYASLEIYTYTYTYTHIQSRLYARRLFILRYTRRFTFSYGCKDVNKYFFTFPNFFFLLLRINMRQETHLWATYKCHKVNQDNIKAHIYILS